MKNESVVSIIGGTVWGNRGAESMLVTTIGMLRLSLPTVRFYVFSYYPDKDRQLIQDQQIQVLSCQPLMLLTQHFFAAFIAWLLKKAGLHIPSTSFFKVAKALDESDILLDIGGITFSDGREKYLPFNILTIWPAILLDIPVVKLAQAVGPFRYWLNRFAARVFLFRCEYLFARGEKTAEYLNEIDYPKDKYQVTADIAFLYQPGFSLSHENDKKVDRLIEVLQENINAHKKTIVFSPSILVETESSKKGLDYSSRFFEIINQLGSKEYQYIFMPNATREHSRKSHNNDLLVIDRMRNRAFAGEISIEHWNAIHWIDFDINTASIRWIINMANALVTSRYHAMISGLSLGVPTIVIGWGHKYHETMAFFKMEKYSIDFSDSERNLVGIILSAIQNEKKIHQQLRKNLGGIQYLSEIQFQFLEKELS